MKLILILNAKEMKMNFKLLERKKDMTSYLAISQFFFLKILKNL
jgi:hypothetical protein